MKDCTKNTDCENKTAVSAGISEMNKKPLNKNFKRVLLYTLCGVLCLYVVTLALLWLFEGESVKKAFDTIDSDSYCLTLYEKYGIEKNSDFYIKALTAEDIDTDSGIVRNCILGLADKDKTYGDVEKYANENGAKIEGYIAEFNFYQLVFASEMSLEELEEKSKEFGEGGIFTCCMPDGFYRESFDTEQATVEETQETNFKTTDSDFYNEYPNSVTKADSVTEYSKYFGDVAVLVTDDFVDYNCTDIKVANSDEYDIDSYFTYGNWTAGHGTHCAGTIASTGETTGVAGLCPEATLYSSVVYNVDLAYIISEFTRFITEKNVRVINCSWGIPSYRICEDYASIAAANGDEEAIEELAVTVTFFDEYLERMIDAGYDFMFVQAAGNDGDTVLQKNPFAEYGCSKKKILSFLDFLNIFDFNTSGLAVADYSTYLTASKNEKVRSHIMVVGNAAAFSEKAEDVSVYCNSSLGKSVEIYAPGFDVWSLYPGNTVMSMSGTSMAAPYVAGTAACIYAMNPGLTAPEVEKIIILSSTDSLSTDYGDVPFLNIEAALQKAFETVK